jgi:hypothetical protein
VGREAAAAAVGRDRLGIARSPVWVCVPPSTNFVFKKLNWRKLNWASAEGID